MDTREKIAAAADELFYRQGFAATPFADIADVIGISRGNFYYHFKTKDEILAAVIERRMDSTRAMLAAWEAETPDPADRICSFISILISNQARIMLHGCPVGTLCTELAKLQHVYLPDAARLFALFRDWLIVQFRALGVDAAEEKALHVIGVSQGVAILAAAFRDEDYVRREVDRLCTWVRCCGRGANEKDRETLSCS